MSDLRSKKFFANKYNNLEILSVINISSSQLYVISKLVENAEQKEDPYIKNMDYLNVLKTIEEFLDFSNTITDDWSNSGKDHHIKQAKRFIHKVREERKMKNYELRLHVYNLLGLCLKCLQGLANSYNYQAIYKGKIQGADLIELERMIERERKIHAR